MALANLIIKIGADISELQTSAAKSTRIMEQTASKIDTIGATMKSTLLAAFSVGAVVSFVDKTLSAASAIHDTAAALGISAEAAQRFGFAASQSGASLDDVGRSLNFMNKALAGGDKGTIAALEAAGLSFDKLRAMSPEQAFLAVTEAVKNITNPMLQAQVGTALLGKSWLALAPAIKEGVAELGNATSVMSNDTVKSLADAQDAWEALSNKVTIVSGTIIGHALNVTSEITSGWKSAAKFAESSMKFGFAVATTLADADGAATKAAASVKAAVPPFKALSDSTDTLTDAQKKAKAATESHIKAIAALRDELSGRGAIKSANDMVQALKGITVAQLNATDSTARVNKVMGDAIDVYRATGRVAPQAFVDLYAATVRVPPVIAGITSDLLRMTQQVRVTIPEVDDLGEGFKVVEGIPFGGHIGQQVSLAIPELKKAEDHVDDLARAFSQMAQVSGGAFGEVLQGIGSMITALDTAQKAIGSIRAGEAAGGAQGLLDTASGYLALAGAAVQAGKALRPLLGLRHGKLGAALGTNASGRSAVNDFAELMGGYDALHAKLATLGSEGELLWVKLTQGVGRSNPDEAAAAINAVSGAFATQQEKIAETSLAVSDLIGNSLGIETTLPPALQATIDKLVTMGGLTRDNAADLLGLTNVGVPAIDDIKAAADRYGLSLNVLGPKIDQLQITDKAAQIVGDWELLARAGADTGAVMAGMSSKVQPLVDSALRFGRELPDSMRPMLEAMAHAGTLTDLTGDKLSDLKGIAFAEPISASVDRLIEKMQELIGSLTHGLGGALDDLGRRTVHVPIKFDVDEMPGGGSTPEFATGTRGGFVNFGSGTYVQLHGRERIVSESESLGLDGGDIVIQLNAGELWDQRVVRVARKDAARGGLKPRTGPGRSY